MKNIYLVGKAGSGKTYSANYLKETYGYTSAKFAFPVYGIAEDYFNMTKKDRTLLQLIGPEAGRNSIDPNIWVNRFREDMLIVQIVRDLLGQPRIPYVLDDCRFPNEHKVLKELGWVGIYLYVNDSVRIKRLEGRDGDAQINTLNHYSETASDSFKHELVSVDCSGSFRESYQALEEALERYVL